MCNVLLHATLGFILSLVCKAYEGEYGNQIFLSPEPSARLSRRRLGTSTSVIFIVDFQLVAYCLVVVKSSGITPIYSFLSRITLTSTPFKYDLMQLHVLFSIQGFY